MAQSLEDMYKDVRDVYLAIYGYDSLTMVLVCLFASAGSPLPGLLMPMKAYYHPAGTPEANTARADSSGQSSRPLRA